MGRQPEAFRGEGDVPGAAGRGDEFLVPIGVLAPQAVVGVRGPDRKAESSRRAPGGVQENHRVDPAGGRHEDAAAGRRTVGSGERAFDVSGEVRGGGIHGSFTVPGNGLGSLSVPEGATILQKLE